MNSSLLEHINDESNKRICQSTEAHSWTSQTAAVIGSKLIGCRGKHAQSLEVRVLASDLL
jgi:hypothetical protein